MQVGEKRYILPGRKKGTPQPFDLTAKEKSTKGNRQDSIGKKKNDEKNTSRVRRKTRSP